MQAKWLNRRELLAIGAGACAHFATRQLYAERVRPTGRIAFVRGDFGHAGNRRIYLMNPDGSSLRPLTDAADSPGEDRPSWSPDSRMDICMVPVKRFHSYQDHCKRWQHGQLGAVMGYPLTDGTGWSAILANSLACVVT